jgi:hypothetical protein
MVCDNHTLFVVYGTGACRHIGNLGDFHKKQLVYLIKTQYIQADENHPNNRYVTGPCGLGGL